MLSCCIYERNKKECHIKEKEKMNEIPRALYMLVGTLGVVSGVVMLEQGINLGYLAVLGSFVVYLAREYIK